MRSAIARVFVLLAVVFGLLMMFDEWRSGDRLWISVLLDRLWFWLYDIAHTSPAGSQ